MKTETLLAGIAVISSVFPKLDLNEDTLNIWEPLLQDLEDDHFLLAVEIFCSDQKEIYPGTNIVATLREMSSFMYRSDHNLCDRKPKFLSISQNKEIDNARIRTIK